MRTDGRFGLKDGYYWTCGDYIEIYDFEKSEWLCGRVEHDSKGYYFTNGERFARLNCSTLARVKW